MDFCLYLRHCGLFAIFALFLCFMGSFTCVCYRYYFCAIWLFWGCSCAVCAISELLLEVIFLNDISLCKDRELGMGLWVYFSKPNQIQPIQ